MPNEAKGKDLMFPLFTVRYGLKIFAATGGIEQSNSVGRSLTLTVYRTLTVDKSEIAKC